MHFVRYRLMPNCRVFFNYDRIFVKFFSGFLIPYCVLSVLFWGGQILMVSDRYSRIQFWCVNFILKLHFELQFSKTGRHVNSVNLTHRRYIYFMFVINSFTTPECHGNLFKLLVLYFVFVWIYIYIYRFG